MHTRGTLRHAARDAATARGHDLPPIRFAVDPRHPEHPVGSAACRRCGMAVTLRPAPRPNEAPLTGEALALACTGAPADALTGARVAA